MTPVKCSRCHAVVQFMAGPNGKSVQVNPDGTPHLCPNAAPVNGTHTEGNIPTTTPVPIPVGNNTRPVIEPVRIPENETTVRQVSVRPDSLEIGSTKTGIIKCYGDASRPEVFMKRIENMITLRERATRAMQSPQDPVGE